MPEGIKINDTSINKFVGIDSGCEIEVDYVAMVKGAHLGNT